MVDAITHRVWVHEFRYILWYISLEIDSETIVTDTAKLFTTGRSQAVRLPIEYRFEGKEVYIRRDPVTGDVVLSRRPESWIDFFRLGASTQVPIDFMTQADRNQGTQDRDPFEGVTE